MLSENEMDRKTRELHGLLQDSRHEELSFKDYTKVLKNTDKNSAPINKKLSVLINTLSGADPGGGPRGLVLPKI